MSKEGNRQGLEPATKTSSPTSRGTLIFLIVFDLVVHFLKNLCFSEDQCVGIKGQHKHTQTSELEVGVGYALKIEKEMEFFSLGQ